MHTIARQQRTCHFSINLKTLVLMWLSCRAFDCPQSNGLNQGEICPSVGSYVRPLAA